MTNASPSFLVGALGDSITTAYNAERPGDNPDWSWATGAAPGMSGGSHLTRLGRLFPTLAMRSLNVAVAGARAADLAAQVGQLVPERPDYVTVLIGANDLSRWLLGEVGILIDGFAADLRQALARLITANPRVMILLVGALDQAAVLQHVIDRGFELPAALLEPFRRVYRERRQTMNRILSELATEHSRNVRFAAEPATLPIASAYLSRLDSYHPSTRGQEVLAGAAWSGGFFPG